MSLQLFAGERAYARLMDEGLNADQLSLIIGASGGPKWLVLSKLDQYLNDYFIKAIFFVMDFEPFESVYK